jgi:hypothetical protein
MVDLLKTLKARAPSGVKKPIARFEHGFLAGLVFFQMPHTFPRDGQNRTFRSCARHSKKNAERNCRQAQHSWGESLAAVTLFGAFFGRSSRQRTLHKGNETEARGKEPRISLPYSTRRRAQAGLRVGSESGFFPRAFYLTDEPGSQVGSDWLHY